MLCEDEIIADFDMSEFENLLRYSAQKYKKQCSLIVPFLSCIVCDVDFEIEDVEDELKIIHESIKRQDCEGGIGFRIDDRVFF